MESNNTTRSKFSLNAEDFVRVLGIVIVCLILLSIVSVAANEIGGDDSIVLHKLKKLFFVEYELNIPSFFSALQLLVASALLFLITFFKMRENDKYRIEWLILAGGFFLMAFDELVSVHERLIEPTRELLGQDHLGVLYFAWVVPMGVVVLSLGVLMFRFWLDLPAKTRILFLISGVVFLGGAVGFELIESWHCEVYGKENLFYMILTTIEESMEMFGVLLFVRAILSFLIRTYGDVELVLCGIRSETEDRDLEKLGYLGSPTRVFTK